MTQDIWYSADETVKVEYEINETETRAPYGNTYAVIKDREIVLDTIEILGVHFPRKYWSEMPTLMDEIEKQIRKELE